MLKKLITYEDWDGNTVTEEFCFNMNQAELMELEFSVDGVGFIESVMAAITAEKGSTVIGAFKNLILMSVGRRVGNKFVKNDEIRDDLVQTNAYSALFMELATDAVAGAAFVNGILPRALAEQAAAKAKLDQVEIQDLSLNTEASVFPVDPPSVVDAPMTKSFSEMSPQEFEDWKNSQES